MILLNKCDGVSDRAICTDAIASKNRDDEVLKLFELSTWAPVVSSSAAGGSSVVSSSSVSVDP